MNQKIIDGWGSIANLPAVLLQYSAKKVMLVHDEVFDLLSIRDEFRKINGLSVSFCDFTSNPKYEDVCKAVALYRAERCDSIVAVGGGSAMDVAKAVKLFAALEGDGRCGDFLRKKPIPGDIPLIAIPTTAGTGSESTRYAVVYYHGEKQSLTHDEIIPTVAILDARMLMTLPAYQKKCTLLDALCQAIESWWSIHSTAESISNSRIAVSLIMCHMEDYLAIGKSIDEETKRVCERMMTAANLAGRAINIAQTTAAHAMSYKLTSQYHLPHGHAVAVCMPALWKYMTENWEDCCDPRGSQYLIHTLDEIAGALGFGHTADAEAGFTLLLRNMAMDLPLQEDDRDIDQFVDSVNLVRLMNTPLPMTRASLWVLYRSIIQKTA